MIDRRSFLAGSAAAGALALAARRARAAEPGVSDTTLPRLLDTRRVIIDTDPGNDDAIAILMALSAPSLSVEAITVAPGNIGYAQEVRNALYMVDLAGFSGRIPVHAGMTRPILGRSYASASFIHGPSGLGQFVVPPVKQQPDPEHAVTAICRIVRRYPNQVVILALGGLTNVAMALLMDPGIARLVKGIQFVANANNAVPSFNAMVDPEAADIVFRSGAPITFGLGGPDSSILTPADFKTVRAMDTARSRFFMQSNALRLSFEMSARNAKGSVNGDPLATAMIIDPAIATGFKAVCARVELEGEYTRGTILYGENRYNMQPTPPPNANLCVAADNARFKALVFRTLAQA
ncbi:nucleoside hydrolase [Acetobacteraceae bacterium KSS8]|uniref:Nucleoside hydrolase n=1 Tax=Endosaccharibacter trunci TaxID=2812733 RepID=A0ABT1W3A1_9PROT|nr:nucleoside hydrolase [Acetobacteraceae bacterium KSS8]